MSGYRTGQVVITREDWHVVAIKREDWHSVCNKKRRLTGQAVIRRDV